MRFKVSIDFIQTTDPDDFYHLVKKREELPDAIKNHIQAGILSSIQDAVDGHGHTLDHLQESLEFAYKDGLVKVRVKYLDDNWYDNDIGIESIL